MHSFTNTSQHFLFTCFVFFVFSILITSTADRVLAAEIQSGQQEIAVEEKKTADPLAEQWGIEITALRITAAGHMIDFRYRVLDAKKAEPLFIRKIKPYLVHHASGKTLAVPNTAKVGSLRNSNAPKENRIYWMFFGNSGLVQKGDKVSIVIGDFKAESLVVL